jgi:hypothetical protein
MLMAVPRYLSSKARVPQLLLLTTVMAIGMSRHLSIAVAVAAMMEVFGDCDLEMT